MVDPYHFFNYDFSTSNVALTAGNKYWAVLTTTGQNGWNLGRNTDDYVSGGGPGTIADPTPNYFSDFGTPSYAAYYTLMLDIETSGTSGAATPEPAAFLLAGTGLAMLSQRARKRRA